MFLLFSLVLFSNCVSVKPIYNSDEQAKAERAVSEIHKLYNEQNFDELYNHLDEETRLNIPKDTILTGIKQTFEKWGKIQSANLSQAKVIPSTQIQVRMIYNIKYEKGDGQEWYIAVIRGDKAYIVQVRNFEGFDKGESGK